MRLTLFTACALCCGIVRADDSVSPATIMLTYARDALASAAWEMLFLFGGVFAIAWMLHVVSTGLRQTGSTVFGRFYYCLVAPGVICHETGHALGCLLTLTRIVKFVPFHPSGNTLGYVTHETHRGLRGAFSEFVIATGPVWFGCVLVCASGVFFGGRNFLPSAAQVFPDGLPQTLWAYASGVISGAVGMVRALTAGSGYPVWVSVLFGYLFFCMASEITLSPGDIKSMRGALFLLIPLIVAANFVPGVSDLLVSGVRAMAPAIFTIHTVLFFVLGVDVIFLFVLWVIRACTVNFR